MKLFRDFLKEEDGLGTVEIVVIIAVLVGLALLFKNVIWEFVRNLLMKIQGDGSGAVNTSGDIQNSIQTNTGK
jgi:Flp pilus assembly pilin Flp